MLKPDVLRALRVIALAEADDLSYDGWYKYICRWYSREFHTPLPQVESMPEEIVLKTYYEDVFWRLANGTEEQKNKLEEIIVEHLQESHHETQSVLADAEEEDDDWYQQELDSFEKKLSKQDTDITQKTERKRSDKILIDKPNLEDVPKWVYTEANDAPVPDDDDDLL